MTYSTSASTTISAPVTVIWNALTKPELVKQYFFGTNLDTTWEVGSPIFFRGEWQGKAYEDKGMVLSYEPMQSLSYNYFSPMSGIEDKPELYQVLTYTLAGEDGNVTVTIDQTNIDDKDRADHSQENWQGVLKLLKEFVEKQNG